jgi:NlpC/P60 family
MFPRLLAACFALAIVSGVSAQTKDPDIHARAVYANESSVKPIPVEAVTVPANTVKERAPLKFIEDVPLISLFRTALSAAMLARVGARYHYGSTGPGTFDCSGFVWSSFQEAGVKFQRGPARSYWAQFQPVSDAERFKFGTLVFFSGLTHIGIVADEKGFYHASRHHGVIYSEFDDYWLSRIDGFRRVPLDTMQIPAAATTFGTPPKPATIASAVEER